MPESKSRLCGQSVRFNLEVEPNFRSFDRSCINTVFRKLVRFFTRGFISIRRIGSVISSMLANLCGPPCTDKESFRFRGMVLVDLANRNAVFSAGAA